MHHSLQDQITRYWTQRSSAFAAQRRRELAGEKHAQWLAELNRFIPAGGGWDILDLGTGSGFFAFLLADQGHRVTGIDLTPAMIEEARRTGAALGSKARFAVMDAVHPDFAPGSFDALVTRNLTWTLPDLPQAYRNWFGLLKPGGLLLNFDADYCHEQSPAALPANHAHKNIAPDLWAEYEQIKADLRPGQQLRPAWDMALLRRAGFEQVQADDKAGTRIYTRPDEFYNPTPMFLLSARKPGRVSRS